MSDLDRSVLVLYGSETGNAQDMAEELGRLCQRLHFRNHIDALDAIDLVSRNSRSLGGTTWLTPQWAEHITSI